MCAEQSKAGAAYADTGLARDARWGGPCPFGQRTAPPIVTAWGTLPFRPKNHLAPGVMTLGGEYAPPGPLVHWSGDPYFGRSRKLPMIEGAKALTRPTREAAGPARPPLPRPACGRRRRA